MVREKAKFGWFFDCNKSIKLKNSKFKSNIKFILNDKLTIIRS